MDQGRAEQNFKLGPHLSPVASRNAVGSGSAQIVILNLVHDLIKYARDEEKVLVGLRTLLDLELRTVLPGLQHHVVQNDLHEQEVYDLRLLKTPIQSQIAVRIRDADNLCFFRREHSVLHKGPMLAEEKHDAADLLEARIFAQLLQALN